MIFNIYYDNLLLRVTTCL